MQTFELYIPSMICSACVAPENTLKNHDRVKVIAVDYVAHLITIETETHVEENFIQQLCEALDEVGYPCAGFLETTLSLEVDQESDAKREEFEIKKQIQTKKAIRDYWIKGSVGTLFGAAILILSLSGVELPLWGMYLEGGISTLLTLYFGKETYQQAATTFWRTQTLSMDSLFTVSTLLALIASFLPGFSPMWVVALWTLGLKNFGKGIEESAKLQLVKHSFRSYAERDVITELSPGIEKTIPVKNLWPNNIIILSKGKTVPVDGICLNKHATIYNTILTGRTDPREIAENDMILAGCIVPDDVDRLMIRVVNREANSYLALLDKRTKAAELEKSEVEDTTAKILRSYFIPGVFFVATLASIIIGAIYQSPNAAVETLISILVSACPCTLGLITPLAMKAGIKKAATLGILFKSGKSIEAAAAINAIGFDLTGTLTTGIFKVVRASQMSPDILSLLHKLESGSTHPIARAICEYTKAQQSSCDEYKQINLDKSYHSGVVADVNNEQVIIGNRSLLALKNIDVTAYDKEIKAINAEQVIYVAKANKAIGYLLFEDPLREDAKPTIDSLKERGLKDIFIVTGTDYQTAKKVADKLGIPEANIYADCVGESSDISANTKTKRIKQLEQRFVIAMVGDGDNDAAALAASRLGIGINSGHGRGGVQQNADVMINQGTLWSIVNMFAIANQTVRNIKQNLWMSVGYNFSSLGIFSGVLRAVSFTINPAFGAAFMNLQTGLILLNVERFKRQALPHIPASSNPPRLSPATIPFKSTRITLSKKLKFRLQQPLISNNDPGIKRSLSSSVTRHYNSLNDSDTELSVSNSLRNGSPRG